VAQTNTVDKSDNLAMSDSRTSDAEPNIVQSIAWLKKTPSAMAGSFPFEVLPVFVGGGF
jgi:hypothetical protein